MMKYLQRVVRFGKRMEQKEQSEQSQSQAYSTSSNRYQSNSEDQTERALTQDDSSGHANYRASRQDDTLNDMQSKLTDPPNPPNLGSRNMGEPFGVRHNNVDQREVIKLSIEFPLRNGNSGNDIALFFKRFITVLFAANREILLTKRIPGDKNPISKAIYIAYNKETRGDYYSGMKTLHDKKRVVGLTRILSGDEIQKTKSHRNFRAWL